MAGFLESLPQAPKLCSDLCFFPFGLGDSGLLRAPLPTRWGPQFLKQTPLLKTPTKRGPRLGSKESVEFGLQRGGRVLLGDEMGLGKTLQAPSKQRTFGLLNIFLTLRVLK